MVVTDDDFAARLLGGGENPLDSARGQRQWTLAQNVDLGFERAQDMRLVQMIRGGDHHGIDLIELEQILDVGEDVGNLHTLGDGARFRAIVVAQRNQLRAFDFGDNGQVRQLRDGPRPDQAEANGVLRRF